MSKISGIVITKNAENLIADCLDSLSFCEEIIIVDNKSNDRTVELGRKMGAKVFEYSSEDFSEIRSFGLKKALNEWVFYVDADERVSKELKESIKSLVNIKNNEISAYKVNRKNFYFGNHEWPYIEKIERLFRKEALKGWKGKLHESPIIDGEVGVLDGFLLHYTHRDLTSMVVKTIEWSKVEAELRFKSGHPKMVWWRFPRVMASAFFNSYIKQGGWRVGTIGIIEGVYQAFSMFITYARLWELQLKRKA